MSPQPVARLLPSQAKGLGVLGFRVYGLGLGCLGFIGFRVYGLGVGVWGLGLRGVLGIGRVKL